MYSKNEIIIFVLSKNFFLQKKGKNRIKTIKIKHFLAKINKKIFEFTPNLPTLSENCRNKQSITPKHKITSQKNWNSHFSRIHLEKRRQNFLIAQTRFPLFLCFYWVIWVRRKCPKTAKCLPTTRLAASANPRLPIGRRASTTPGPIRPFSRSLFPHVNVSKESQLINYDQFCPQFWPTPMFRREIRLQ